MWVGITWRALTHEQSIVRVTIIAVGRQPTDAFNGDTVVCNDTVVFEVAWLRNISGTATCHVRVHRALRARIIGRGIPGMRSISGRASRIVLACPIGGIGLYAWHAHDLFDVDAHNATRTVPLHGDDLSSTPATVIGANTAV